jgi:Raf kinase inhibitor-like YbhB/YbcL family protein
VTGGASSGGASSGGTASGGASSGGAASGGASSGGAASGGAASGGASSGGAASGGASSSGGSSSGALVLTSPVVQDGAKIPARFRCQAPSPELAWSGGPAAQSYAIVFRDVTPGISNGVLHWIIYDLPPSTRSLPEAVPVGYAVAAPAGAHQGKAYNGTVGFQGPCGGNNTYEMTLYALDVATLTELSSSSTAAAARTAIEAHDTASVKLTILSSP